MDVPREDYPPRVFQFNYPTEYYEACKDHEGELTFTSFMKLTKAVREKVEVNLLLDVRFQYKVTLFFILNKVAPPKTGAHLLYFTFTLPFGKCLGCSAATNTVLATCLNRLFL